MWPSVTGGGVPSTFNHGLLEKIWIPRPSTRQYRTDDDRSPNITVCWHDC